MSTTSTCRLSNKVTIVTGAAQGFGEGIARELAKNGARLVIADLNLALAQSVADSINSGLPGRRVASGNLRPTNQDAVENGARASREQAVTINGGAQPSRQAVAINGGAQPSRQAVAVKVDVSNEESVANLVAETVRAFGGIDLLVSNAGVLRAGSLDEMTLADFEFVTKVNYTAFFLLTKHVSRVMKERAASDPAYTADIIQINSKSGLEGSDKNFAYAGGKFGGIGLVQSFAKELCPHRIKVNAICPGNYYEGPLWSDPERGLFVQYLRAGKVPGAKTIEDVKNAYVSKVPMRRGCSPLDVARAIMYCVEQEYETGQAIPVTGGQVMLN